jgi:tetratricopeptide (TPR) repeat protein
VTDYRSKLQDALGGAYTLEQELGGGGMSRVFVARENALGREVVVKVLPTDVAGVSVERFKREIMTAARLQHPHIVPLLSAGEVDGVPYFTMPFVKGEGLRQRLRREGQLPAAEAVRLLRDVAAALAYAHREGVVHRDIKPDNVLLSGGSATVTDFGVAKALRDAAGTSAGESLTQIGIALGTPLYMAPEQAAADPGVDHRADLYAFGVMAYEMLAGAPPFSGRPAQELLVAHLTERPESILAKRPDLSPELASLIMRCLAKRPEDRPQSADDIVAALDQVTTTGGRTRITTVLLGPLASSEPVGGTGRRAFALYLAAAALTALMAKIAVVLFALPDWVFTGAAALLALGLPLFAVTAWRHRRAKVRHTPGGAGGIRPTWRQAAVATAGTLVSYALFVSGFVMLRALGIGPGASLLAAGKLKDHEQVLVADFATRGTDSTLAGVLTEAFRTDLRQSKVVTLVQDGTVRQALARMQRPAASRLDSTLAREVAQRLGIKAVIGGEVQAVGTGFLLVARLTDAGSGNELVAFRESAADAGALIPAIDRLSKKLREKIGESLRQIRAEPPLEQVTTASLDALKAYAEGSRLMERDGDLREAMAHLENAIKLDTTFAMAYRKLGILLSNTGIDRPRGDRLIIRALAYSQRLPELERFLTEGTYYMNVANDREKALAAYRAALTLDPQNYIALNNAAIVLLDLRQPAEAERLLKRQIAADSSRASAWSNLVSALAAQGKMGEARKAAEAAVAHFPQAAPPAINLATLEFVDGQYDGALATLARFEKSMSPSPENRLTVAGFRQGIDMTRGRLAAAFAGARASLQEVRAFGVQFTPLDTAMGFASSEVFFLGDTAGARRRVDQALAAAPLAKMEPARRPYYTLAQTHAYTGRPALARQVIADHDAAIRDSITLRAERDQRNLTMGAILLAEGKAPQAIAELRKADLGKCTACVLPLLGYAYDLAGERDSAIAVLDRYRRSTDLSRSNLDQQFLAASLKRLGELYDQAGDAKHALEAYEQFTRLWQDADPALQPKVKQVRARAEQLRSKLGT